MRTITNDMRQALAHKNKEERISMRTIGELIGCSESMVSHIINNKVKRTNIKLWDNIYEITKKNNPAYMHDDPFSSLVWARGVDVAFIMLLALLVAVVVGILVVIILI